MKKFFILCRMKFFQLWNQKNLIKYPFSEVQLNINKIPFEKLRTSEERKEFITKLAPFVNSSNSWEEAIWEMIDHYKNRR
jgi:hypothetical protein